MRHAVLTAGGRIRPQLCLGAAIACGDRDPTLAIAAATAIEILHCASLVHDDLPSFDNASTRRGHPTVHAAFGEQIAVLAGDALIVLAFDTLAGVPDLYGRRSEVTQAVARGVGAQGGIVAGQAWESEPEVDLAAYHRAKTAALFEAAVVAGAIAGGGDGEAWRPVGTHFGLAYQLADDVADRCADAGSLGKPVGQDDAHRRPNAVAALGFDGAIAELAHTLRSAIDSVPPSPNSFDLTPWVVKAVHRLLPDDVAAIVEGALQASNESAGASRVSSG